MSFLRVVVRPPTSGRARDEYEQNTDDHTFHHRPSSPRNQKADGLFRVPLNGQGQEGGSGGGRDRARVSCSDRFEHRPALILRAFGMSGPAASTRRAPTFLGHSTATRQSAPLSFRAKPRNLSPRLAVAARTAPLRPHFTPQIPFPATTPLTQSPHTRYRRTYVRPRTPNRRNPQTPRRHHPRGDRRRPHSNPFPHRHHAGQGR